MALLTIDQLINIKENADKNDILNTILDTLSFDKVELPDLEICDLDSPILDDIYVYDDIINALPGEINNIKVIKYDNKKYLCFRNNNSRGNQRSLKQKLSDVTTSEIIQNMTNENYDLFLHDFYNAMNSMIELYISTRKPKVFKYNKDTSKGTRAAKIPNDICFYYKGGNIYRILLILILRVLLILLINLILKNIMH